VRETRVTAASGGHGRPAQEDVWTSPEAFQAAVVLFGDGPSRRMDGQRVPRGVGAAALASAWNRQTEALRRAVRDAHRYVLEDAMPVLARAMSVAADSAAAFDLFTQEVERLRQVAAVPPSPVRFDAGQDRCWRDLCLCFVWRVFTAGARRQVMLWRCLIHLARSWGAVAWTERVWIV